MSLNWDQRLMTKSRPVPTELPHGATVHDALKELLDNYHDINSQTVTELEQEPTPLEFMRYVARNQPFVIRNNANKDFGPITQRWTPSYICQKLGSTKVTVALTPAGNADAVVHLAANDGSLFCKPYQVQESFSSAVQAIIAQEQNATPSSSPAATRYIQSQNDNLRSEYRHLFAELPAHIPWATEALQHEPDAVNLWLGNSHSTSALHKDHYENIFVQLAGAKHFVLLPPVQSPCVNERAVLSATYAPLLHPPVSTLSHHIRKDDLCIQIDEPMHYVPLPMWDPDRPGENTSPYSPYARPMRVTVRQGDVLYLPALWYHKVKQVAGHQGVCCSVNYWYDMDFTGQFQVATMFVGEIARLESRARQ
ncbi:hypothetical protein ACEQ8H_002514 [Pleosporales sp. CAS-2024a]